MEYKVALAQMNSKVGDVEANLEKMANLIGRARDEGAKLTVFPEMCLSGYMVMDGKDFKTFYECAETIDGPSVEAMRSQARENDMYIIFGMPLESSEVKGIFYNSSIL
ncbi:MAG: carbon-nitrogen hydrolase family protein, partial [Candidatus Freyarchaeota archaeon]